MVFLSSSEKTIVRHKNNNKLFTWYLVSVLRQLWVTGSNLITNEIIAWRLSDNLFTQHKRLIKQLKLLLIRRNQIKFQYTWNNWEQVSYEFAYVTSYNRCDIYKGLYCSCVFASLSCRFCLNRSDSTVSYISVTAFFAMPFQIALCMFLYLTRFHSNTDKANLHCNGVIKIKDIICM